MPPKKPLCTLFKGFLPLVMIILNLFLLSPVSSPDIIIISGDILISLKNILLKEIRETEFMAISRPKEHRSEYRYSKMV